MWHVVLLPGGTRAVWPSRLDGQGAGRGDALLSRACPVSAARTAAGDRPGIRLTAWGPRRATP